MDCQLSSANHFNNFVEAFKFICKIISLDKVVSFSSCSGKGHTHLVSSFLPFHRDFPHFDTRIGPDDIYLSSTLILLDFSQVRISVSQAGGMSIGLLSTCIG